MVEPFPADPDHWIWSWGQVVGGFDALPYWLTADVPVLCLYGGQDQRIRIGRCIKLITAHLLEAGANATLVVFGPNGHGMFRDDAVDLVAQ